MHRLGKISDHKLSCGQSAKCGSPIASLLKALDSTRMNQITKIFHELHLAGRIRLNQSKIAGDLQEIGKGPVLR